ncbi:MAG: amino acid ABC transporter ATP-binding protein, partial [Erysipelotrichaceae bacterium]|nr:amino acid ABC transporter ATP-binding protein [Erysipelotrichaceae bacterium]
MALIEVRNLEKSFDGQPILKGISFDLQPNEVISIIGSSGCGKSTTLRCINLLEYPDGGDILFHGESILTKGFNLSRYNGRDIASWGSEKPQNENDTMPSRVHS